MPISLQGITTDLQSIIQDNTLERVFHDALFPRLLFRAEATPEFWPANIGERMIFTRAGNIPVTTTPLTAGVDPSPASYSFEQWAVEANQYGGSLDTHMPTSRTALAPKVLRDTQQLGLNAGLTLNTLVRNRLFMAYLGGSTVATAIAAISQPQVPVASLNGFTETLDSSGRPVNVNATNTIPVSFGGTAADNEVIAAEPDDPNNPFGPGTLTMSANLSAQVAAREAVLADNRSTIQRVGGGNSVDAVGATDLVTMNDIIDAVQSLAANNVPPHNDGFYHCHLNPTAVAQLYRDNQWQRLHQSLPESAAYVELSIGKVMNCYHYQNTEAPNFQNVGTLVSTGTNAQVSGEIGAEVINETSVNIGRVIITGGGAIYEKYVDEGEFLSEAGVTGKIGHFSIVNGGVGIMTNRIRYIMRAPLDRLQQVIAQSWSWSGDFGIPSDILEGSAARFKRAIVIEHTL